AVDTRETPRVSTLLLPLINPAHFPKGFMSSFRPRQTRSDVVINEALQMVSELFVELPFHLAALEQRQETQTKLAGPAHALNSSRRLHNQRDCRRQALPLCRFGLQGLTAGRSELIVFGAAIVLAGSPLCLDPALL